MIAPIRSAGKVSTVTVISASATSRLPCASTASTDGHRAFACDRNRCSDETVCKVSCCHGVVSTVDIHHCAIDCIWSQRHLCIEGTVCASSSAFKIPSPFKSSGIVIAPIRSAGKVSTVTVISHLQHQGGASTASAWMVTGPSPVQESLQ